MHWAAKKSQKMKEAIKWVEDVAVTNREQYDIMLAEVKEQEKILNERHCIDEDLKLHLDDLSPLWKNLAQDKEMLDELKTRIQKMQSQYEKLR